ncbi:MAG: J domain-containing protein [Deltaproteobacteria bacterium]|jgi:preprotein translocase subunit Sec63|nr:J domain-containing protein [Deltaproteobacteria bacterium]
MRPKSEPDPYAVLGVARTASEAEIRAAYLDLMAKYHPDRHQGNPLEELAAAKVAEINWAYEILSDPTRRAAYDSGQLDWARVVRGDAGPAAVRRRRRWMLVVGILLLLPLLFRFGSLLLRVLARLYRVVAEGLTVVRGTPVALVAVLLALVLVLLVVARRRRRRSDSDGRR